MTIGCKTAMAALSVVLLASMATGTGAEDAKPPGVPSMIKAVYAGFDPRKDPLEVEMIKEWDEGGIHIEQLYFTGQVIDGVKTRVYAYRAAPRTGERLPGILYCHGGGQTAYLEWVRFWANRGYVCVSFDYSGDTNKYGLPEYKREHFTKWGPAVEKMMAEFGGKPAAERSPKGDSWYHFCLAAMRSMTLLESHPRVDPNKLGAYGVSAGGYMCWQLAAIDKRVKTIVPIYGAGSAFRDTNGNRPEHITPEMALAKYRESPGNPEFYAPMVTCPVLYLTATNDGSFNLDYSMDTVDALGSKLVRLLYSPRCSHHIEPAESPCLPMWMDWQLKGKGGPWPETPGIEISSANGVPRIRVRPDNGSPIQRVDVYYCLNTSNAMRRFWRDARGTRKDGQDYVADAPFMSTGDRVFAFANVIYRSGVRVSSRVVSAYAATLPGAKPTLQREAMIDTMETARYWNWVPAYPDPKIYESYLEPWTGPAGERGFTARPFECDNPPFVMNDGTLKFYFGTAKIGDPQWRGQADDKALLIDYYSPLAPKELVVHLAAEGVKGQLTDYAVQPELARGEAGWVTLRMERTMFRHLNAETSLEETLSRWDTVRHIALSGVSDVDRTPVFRNLRWER